MRSNGYSQHQAGCFCVAQKKMPNLLKRPNTHICSRCGNSCRPVEPPWWCTPCKKKMYTTAGYESIRVVADRGSEELNQEIARRVEIYTDRASREEDLFVIET